MVYALFSTKRNYYGEAYKRTISVELQRLRRILRSYDEKAFSFTDHFMRTSFYFEGLQRLGERLGDGLGESRANLTYTRQRILELMEIDSRISIVRISQELGFSTTAIEKNIDWLKENGYRNRQGSAKSGYWEILR